MINLTEPLLPNKNDLYKLIDNIYESKHLTNRGSLHEKYNILVKEYLGVKYSFPFVNGHSALVSAIKSLEINNSEIITSAFTYCSSTISILETNNIPVFVDVDEFGNIDTQKIEEKINTKTKAILAIHVFGEPCNIKKLEYIARKYNLYLIFDAAHAFGIKVDNIGIGNFGNISMFSTHATKIFNTIEGGLLTYKNVEYDRIIKSSTTFGLNETNDNTIMLAGNNKMNEFQSAFGILNLNEIDNSIIKRKNKRNIEWLI
jgi:dTDP-4-amino-4,6-dideoxygalactose transaminase